MRLLVYTDYVYRRDSTTAVYAERAFALFLIHLAERLDVTVVGRLHPAPGRSHYRLPDALPFVPLPYYASASRAAAVPAMLRSLRSFWRALDTADGAWVLGPSPLSVAFAVLAALRRRRVVLGVRQDMQAYVRSRHPDRRVLHLAARVLDSGYHLLARRAPVIVVGPALERRYRRAPDVLAIAVSLVRDVDVVADDEAPAWPGNGDFRALSVGRLEAEKNPLLLADILAGLRKRDQRWRLVVCGEGPLEDALRERLREVGVAEHAELRGYVPVHGGLWDAYRESQVLLHVSWTEGLPQVLFEAFAAALPVVATAVGGVPSAAGGAALLVPPGDAGAAIVAVTRLADDPRLRDSLVHAGLEVVREHTLEAEVRRVARFLERAVQRG